MPSPSQRNYSSVAQQTTVSGALTNSVTTVTVAALTGYPAAPFCAAIDYGSPSEELVLVTNVSGLNLTVTRGFSGSTAVSHLSGAVFQHVHVSQDFTDYSQHVFASTGVHGVTGSVVGTTDAQTLSNKTLVSPVFTGNVEIAAIDDANGNAALQVGTTASAVNDVTVTNAATGGAPSVAATGADANISLNLQTKGTGIVEANGVAVVDLSSTQTLSGKTLTTPTVNGGSVLGAKHDVIKDTNGNTSVVISAIPSAVNNIAIVDSISGQGPTIQSQGADNNVPLNLNTKGIAGVLINNVPVVDTLSTQTLGNKTFASATFNAFMVIGAGNPDATAAWSSYTPVVNATTTNPGAPSTAEGYYMKIGKTVHFRFRVAWSSGSAGNGTYLFSLPFATASTYSSAEAIGGGVGFAGTGGHQASLTAIAGAGVTSCTLTGVDVNGSTASAGQISSTFGNTGLDYRICGTYEAA